MVRFRVHSPGTVGAIKIDWEAPVELSPELRDAMAPHDLDTMRAGILLRGFVVGGVTYPRGTIAFRVADAHELFLQLPADTVPLVARKVVIATAWTVERDGTIDRYRGTVGTEDDGERVDVIIATRAPNLSRTKAQRLIEEGQVRVGGQPTKKMNQRLAAGDLIELESAHVIGN